MIIGTRSLLSFKNIPISFSPLAGESGTVLLQLLYEGALLLVPLHLLQVVGQQELEVEPQGLLAVELQITPAHLGKGGGEVQMKTLPL